MRQRTTNSVFVLRRVDYGARYLTSHQTLLHSNLITYTVIALLVWNISTRQCLFMYILLWVNKTPLRQHSRRLVNVIDKLHTADLALLQLLETLKHTLKTLLADLRWMNVNLALRYKFRAEIPEHLAKFKVLWHSGKWLGSWIDARKSAQYLLDNETCSITYQR